jgi:outer membrane protein assembly factor BamB
MRYTIVFLYFSLALACFGQSTNWSLKVDSASIFSSPRFTDLNRDGVMDVIIGGGLEHQYTQHAVIAVDGKNGQLLWEAPSRSQLYTSALFQDITGDGIMDVFIGGREACFMSIDGATGEILWEFWKEKNADPRKAGWLNFFCTQWVEDQNKDGYKDLLVTNGGDYLALPNQKKRPAARIMILSGKNGDILNDVSFHEDRESYYAPHTIIDSEGNTKIIYASGGETVDGSLWSVDFTDLSKRKMKISKLLLKDEIKGIILNSILADLNGDKHDDLVVAHMSGKITAVDIANNRNIWQKEHEGYECYVTPSFGYFNEDKIPDVFTILAFGSFPMYSSFKLIVLDGKDGSTIYSEETGFNQYSPGVSADIDHDGIDELIYVHNTLIDQEKFTTVNQVRVVDINDNSNYFIGIVRPGVSMASSPSLVDSDNDGKMELIIGTSSLPMEGFDQYSIIESISLPYKDLNVSWPGYLGPYENGILKK